jgi:hypothetical protein
VIRLPVGVLGYVKLGAGVAVLGAVIWLGFIVKGWKDDAALLALRTAERDQAYADLEQRSADFAEVQEASHAYQTELADLRTAHALERVPVVRLCKPAPQAQPRLSPTVPGPDAASPAPGILPSAPELQAGPDIGPGLFADADRADELSAQVRGLQQYATGCSRRQR